MRILIKILAESHMAFDLEDKACYSMLHEGWSVSLCAMIVDVIE